VRATGELRVAPGELHATATPNFFAASYFPGVFAQFAVRWADPARDLLVVTSAKRMWLLRRLGADVQPDAALVRAVRENDSTVLPRNGFALQ
jgi:hypothetical protein